MGSIGFLFTLCKDEPSGAVVQKTREYVMISTHSKRVKYHYIFGFEDFFPQNNTKKLEFEEDLSFKEKNTHKEFRYIKFCLAEKRIFDIRDSLAWLRAEEYRKLFSLLMLAEQKNKEEELLRRVNELKIHFISLYSKDNVFKV